LVEPKKMRKGLILIVIIFGPAEISRVIITYWPWLWSTKYLHFYFQTI